MSNKSNAIQIIGGEYRSRKISFNDFDGLRPTSSRIRETLFNWLAPHIEGANVLDLFAGSGALSFESASRGAKCVYCVEIDNKSHRQILKTTEQLGCNNLTAVQADAKSYLKSISNHSIDIAFIDPPFATALQSPMLNALASSQCLTNNAKVYVEIDKSEPLAIPEGYSILKQKSSGNVTYYLLSFQHSRE